MASPLAVEALLLLFLLAFTHVGFSMSQMLKGSVTCLDCAPHHNLSGVVVAVKCAHMKQLLPAITNTKGYFTVSIPAPTPTSSPTSAPECFARLLGGREQLCASEQSIAANIVAVDRGSNGYDLASPLAYLSKCPLNVFGLNNKVGAEKASSRASPPKNSAPNTGAPPRFSDEAPPRSSGEAPPYGLGIPLIYLFPFIPIIGIP